ncbi:NlpC/P60 family protein [Otariodibacter sp.]|uniref:NlpC/P60 family protein n=1 Tax=Otariodibacter sp. TaxID=3030919 RepID=UPI0026172849|nr:NlpC/P60 family protein [Otariodibacter sp.]
MQKSFFKLTQYFGTTTVIILGLSFSSLSHASLSTKAATPSQILKNTHKSVRNFDRNINVSKVLSVYHDWAGTRYRFGGTTKAGIDCSAFVQVVMSKAFNMHLPRVTTGQKNMGKSISKSELRPGDLVFFRKNGHVGVYIGDGKFVHSSTSQGVTTSSLSDRYWSRNYTQSRRVL